MKKNMHVFYFAALFIFIISACHPKGYSSLQKSTMSGRFLNAFIEPSDLIMNNQLKYKKLTSKQKRLLQKDVNYISHKIKSNINKLLDNASELENYQKFNLRVKKIKSINIVIIDSPLPEVRIDPTKKNTIILHSGLIRKAFVQSTEYFFSEVDKYNILNIEKEPLLTRDKIDSIATIISNRNLIEDKDYLYSLLFNLPKTTLKSLLNDSIFTRSIPDTIYQKFLNYSQLSDNPEFDFFENSKSRFIDSLLSFYRIMYTASPPKLKDYFSLDLDDDKDNAIFSYYQANIIANFIDKELFKILGFIISHEIYHLIDEDTHEEKDADIFAILNYSKLFLNLPQNSGDSQLGGFFQEELNDFFTQFQGREITDLFYYLYDESGFKEGSILHDPIDDRIKEINDFFEKISGEKIFKRE